MNKQRGLIIISLIIVIILALLLNSFFGQGKKCAEQECFDSLMSQCNYGSYINEEEQASWKYEIQGKNGEECVVKVTLLQAKEGDLELRDFERHTMECSFEFGKVSQPEEDLSACHGRLKEDLQELLIKKLHSYILENLDQIREELLN